MAQQWFSVKQACELLAIGRTTLYRRINAGDIKTKKADDRTTMCLIDVPDATGGETTDVEDADDMVVQVRSEVEHLRAELGIKNKQIDELHQLLMAAEGNVKTLAGQLEQSQRLLEYHKEPWYRRWFRKIGH